MGKAQSLADFAAEVQNTGRCVVCDLAWIEEVNAEREKNERQRGSGASNPTMLKWLAQKGAGHVTLHHIKRHFQEGHHRGAK